MAASGNKKNRKDLELCIILISHFSPFSLRLSMLHILSQAFFFFFSLFFNLSVIRFCQNIFLIFGQFAMKKDPTAVLKFGTAIAFHKSNNEYINSYRFKGRFLLTKYINQVVNIQFLAFCCYFFLFNILLLIFFLYIDSIYTKNNTKKNNLEIYI